MVVSESTPRITVGVPFDGMTWAELRSFVHLCRDTPDAEPVELTLDRDSYNIVGFEERVPVSSVAPTSDAPLGASAIGGDH